MELNKEKFKNALHYIISKTENNVGKSVLYKILYFSDFNFFELYEKPLTYESYRKLPSGSKPIHFDIAINELMQENKISVETKKSYFNKIIFEYASLKEPENNLSDRELDVIDKAIRKLSKMNVTQLSEYIHGDMPWRATEDNAIIKYSFVFYRDSKYSVRYYNDTD